MNNITTRSAYAAILDHFFQPPTSETKILRYGFFKESFTNVYIIPFLITQEVKLQVFQLKIIPTYSQQDVPCVEQGCLIPIVVGHVRPNLKPFHTCSFNALSAVWIAFQLWWCERTLRTFELNECNVIYGW